VWNYLAPDKLKKLNFQIEDLESPAQCLQIGHETALVSRESLFEAFSSIPERMAYLFLPFDTYNGWHTIVDYMQHPLLTTEFMSKAHIFEARQRTNIDLFNGIRTDYNSRFIDNFLHTIGGKPKPAVSGSDAHALAEYGVFPTSQQGESRCTWLKAETTFRGIGQITIEPATRIFIGDEPIKRILVRQHPTKYIKSLTFQRRDGSDLKESWFDGIELHFNHDLVAIVGNRGTGKSALADILGLLGASKNHGHFSFLNSEKFCDPKSSKARHFEATLRWENGEEFRRALSEKPAPTEIERVRYLPQNYLESVCNEIRLRTGDGFDGELKSVIFSHVPFADRLGFDTLDKLIAYRNKQTKGTIDILKSQLHEINVQLASLEKRSTADYRQNLQNQILLKEQEIRAHETTKPTEILPPSADPSRLNEAFNIGQNIERIRADLSAAESEIKHALAEENRLTILLARLAGIEGQLGNFERVFHELALSLTSELADLDIPIADVITLTTNRHALAEKRASLERDIVQTKLLSPNP
jgi:energy-coupling factor transporter ATP-binding protein EcfA2